MRRSPRRMAARIAIRHAEHRMIPPVRLRRGAASWRTDPRRGAPWGRSATAFRSSRRPGGTWPVRGRRPEVGLMLGDAAEVRGQADAAGGVAARVRREIRTPRSAPPRRRSIRRRCARGRRDCWCGRGSGCRFRRRTADRADWCGRWEWRRRRADVPPASRLASRAAADCAGRACRRCTPVPATSIESLIENGTPSSGPSGCAAGTLLIRRCRRFARAGLASTSTTAFRRGSPRSMRSRCASTNSADEIAPFADQPSLCSSGERQDFVHGSLMTRC